MNDDYDHYSVIMEWDATDRIYVVTVPELPGCMTHGSTLEEASSQAKDAIEGWVDACRAWGHPIPQAAYFDLNCDSHITHIVSDDYGDGVETSAPQSQTVERRSA